VSHVSYSAWRFYLVLALIFLAAAGLLWRVFDLTILDQTFLRQQGDERVLRLMSSSSVRGMILERHGYPLAVSTKVFSVWINPKEFSPSKAEITKIAKVLTMKPKELSALYKRHHESKREFIYIKRALSPAVAAEIKALNLPGLYTQAEYRRYYPEGEAASHVVGFTNVDDKGQEGLELAYEKWLDGDPGKQWVIKDRLGRVISKVESVQEQKAGRDLELSIDRRIQYLAYRELLTGVKENQAVSGSAIVLDVKTGEVLAMVNQPSFNPNNRPAKMSDVYRNRAVTDTFEPGSTIKAFSVASALDSKRFKPTSVINTYPGWLRVGHNLVRDEHTCGLFTVTQILQKSSNVGVTKMVLELPPNQLWSMLHRVGFGEITGIGFPGEQSGSLVKHDPWGAFTLATLGFGYGLSVTPLQLARAYSVIANHGVILPVTLLKRDAPPVGEKVMDAKIANEMLTLLESVVSKGGTGESANVPGYRVAGKTGTAIKVGEHGYQKHHYVASFVGIAPVTDPRLVVAVVIDDPQGENYYGGMVAGPVFEKIMEGTLRILDVPPDVAS
jgi:cell division protein FtsI (penicillin-binding protein 3)